MSINFFQSIGGRDSSTRLIGFTVILYAMLMGFLVLYWGKEKSESVISLATSVGILFSTIAGPTFIWMYGQKKTEQKQELHEN